MVKKIVLILVHSVVLLLLHLVYFNLNWSLPLEFEIMMKLTKTESFLGGKGRIDKEDYQYLFINTAYDQMLVRGETEYGDSGTIAIADRYMLTEFFEKMAEYDNKHQFILCDILFDHPSPADSLLNNSLSKVRQVIAPTGFNEEQHKPQKPVVNILAAQADYITYEGLVSKVRLFAEESKTKTLPLLMYEKRNDVEVKVKQSGLFYRSNYIPRSVYPRYFFDAAAMKQHELRLKQVLDMLKLNGKGFYENAMQNKIIIIGDFVNDNHHTFIGTMPGSLVLFNTYLTLQAGYHMLGISWFLFALVAFAGLCFYELYYKKEGTMHTNKNLHKLFMHLLGVSTLCLLISIISGMIFGVHITIIPVIVYLELVRYLRKLAYLKRKK